MADDPYGILLAFSERIEDASVEDDQTEVSIAPSGLYSSAKIHQQRVIRTRGRFAGTTVALTYRQKLWLFDRQQPSHRDVLELFTNSDTLEVESTVGPWEPRDPVDRTLDYVLGEQRGTHAALPGRWVEVEEGHARFEILAPALHTHMRAHELVCLKLMRAKGIEATYPMATDIQTLSALVRLQIGFGYSLSV